MNFFEPKLPNTMRGTMSCAASLTTSLVVLPLLLILSSNPTLTRHPDQTINNKTNIKTGSTRIKHIIQHKNPE